MTKEEKEEIKSLQRLVSSRDEEIRQLRKELAEAVRPPSQLVLLRRLSRLSPGEQAQITVNRDQYNARYQVVFQENDVRYEGEANALTEALSLVVMVLRQEKQKELEETERQLQLLREELEQY
jgi:hypothetical protein